MIEGIIFDAEGVVIDTEAMWDLAQEALLREHGHRYDRDEVKPLLTGRSSLEGATLLKERYGLPGTAEAIAARREALVVAHLAAVSFVPGFRDFFAAVDGPYETAVATGMDPAMLQIVDDRLHLRRLFGGRVFTLEDVNQRSKPNPDLFLFAAARIGAAPDACVVIEDAPYGVTAARRAGMRCIGLATTYGPELLGEADVVVETFQEIDLQALASSDPAA